MESSTLKEQDWESFPVGGHRQGTQWELASLPPCPTLDITPMSALGRILQTDPVNVCKVFSEFLQLLLQITKPQKWEHGNLKHKRRRTIDCHLKRGQVHWDAQYTYVVSGLNWIVGHLSGVWVRMSSLENTMECSLSMQHSAYVKY